MAKIKVKLEEWIDYLESRVGIDLYVWGGNGELLVNLLPKLCEMEKSDHSDKEALNNIDRINALLQKRLLQHIDIYKIRCEDCSGLAVRFLLEKGIIKSDTTANGLFEKIAKEVSLDEVKAGDYLFMGTEGNKTHVGYAISSKYAIESKGRDDGVVQTKISDRGWKWCKRPDWYEGDPEKPVLKRELYLTDPYMKGDDVKTAQFILERKEFTPGTCDGVFGKKTENAVKGFQEANGLKADGIIGKNTAEALGFRWEG